MQTLESIIAGCGSAHIVIHPGVIAIRNIDTNAADIAAVVQDAGSIVVVTIYTAANRSLASFTGVLIAGREDDSDQKK